MSVEVIGSRRTAKILFFSFIGIAIATFIGGFFVVDKVRQRAKQADGALRLTAWACLSYAQAAGTWPSSQDALLAAREAWTSERLPVTDAQWPATKEIAMAGMVAPPTSADAMEIAGLEFSGDPRDAPRINARGNPSGLDTLEVVNGWLTAYVKTQVGAPKSSSSVP